MKYLILFTFVTSMCLGQSLEKMPVDLETDFALSSLPPHLREKATVYLLDPAKGYYVARQGTNGFTAMVIRTEWEWEEYTDDCLTALSYDAEGSKTIIPVYLEVAAMRASGKYSPAELRQAIIKKVKDGTLKAPARPGISYMLAPIMRSHPGTKEVETMIMPHYMFYAPNLTNADIGGKYDGTSQPFILESDPGFGKDHAILNYIIVKAGEAEIEKILKENANLLDRLAQFRPSLKVNAGLAHHH
ncbi:MAG: hypothetical protein WDO15_29965 [Bacteroidota bacterium]